MERLVEKDNRKMKQYIPGDIGSLKGLFTVRLLLLSQLVTYFYTSDNDTWRRNGRCRKDRESEGAETLSVEEELSQEVVQVSILLVQVTAGETTEGEV